MKRIYLDYAATTPLDSRVRATMRASEERVFGNPGSLHSFGQHASREVFRGKQSITEHIGVTYDELVMTASATEANNLALRGVLDAVLKREKPEIIISAIEHESVRETVRALKSVKIIELPVSKDGLVSVSEIKKAITPQTILVSVMYVNNEVGAIEPIAKIGAAVKEVRGESVYPLLHTDAAQALQYEGTNVSELGIDLMTMSAHKIYGPKGIGALYIRKEIQDKVQPILTGGGQEMGLRGGTENVSSIVGFAKAFDVTIAMQKKEEARVKKMRNYFWKEIKKIYPNAKLNGPAITSGKRIANNLNVYFPGVPAHEFLIKLDLLGVAASAGAACSARTSEESYVVQVLYNDSKRARESIRFTLGRQTTKKDIDSTLSILKRITKD